MLDLDPGIAGNRYQEISLETERDEAWCAELIEKYHAGEYRLVLQASYMFVYEQKNHFYQGMPNLVQVHLDEFDEDGLILDGRMQGVRLLPVETEIDGEIWLEYLPHAILTDVDELVKYEDGPSSPMTEDPYTRFFVPLPLNNQAVTLYHPSNLSPPLSLDQ